MSIIYKKFEVAGAGQIRIGDRPSAVTANVAGFSFDVSWGRFPPFSGGVMSRAQAKELADHIYKALENCTDTEEERVSKAYQFLSR